MERFFQKKEETFTFYNREGEQIDRVTEVRFDPLTGETSRLVFDPGIVFTAPDYSELSKKTKGKNCPFCPENVEKMTPVFSKNQHGNIQQGEAVVFPNLFPYSKYNGVVVFSERHYIRLEEFSKEEIANAFLAAQRYARQVQENEKQHLHLSINWNYLPESGGSILHPHLHVILSETETNTQRIEAEKLQNFKATYGKDYFSALYDIEKKERERWIGEQGGIAWIHAYAPKSHNDYIGLFRGSHSILDITETEWEDFATTLQVIFKNLEDQGLASFNLSLKEGTGMDNTVHARLIPRVTLGEAGTSDINFFHSLHHEPLSYKSPEDIATAANRYFNKK
ncbi:HIT domain-containing protein [Alteribacillus iranensis]|uniref:Galactose-1-phosphate uridylyltransferase n=1 Tax=Alteribacillus iranensis TaxID=930128 RepID=A0A1I1Z2H7_9BACI|nr:HIT domain-containing protein [Alteribacillus iranensis]SFE25929.1 Galactose-1-phosphate uridylyltransferase [Alteribacillus iranensis]